MSTRITTKKCTKTDKYQTPAAPTEPQVLFYFKCQFSEQSNEQHCRDTPPGVSADASERRPYCNFRNIFLDNGICC